MKFIFAILILCTSLYSQSQWWAAADSSQKAFALQCIEYGNTLGHLTSWTDSPGETLAGIAWMEVSFVEDLEHDEDSSGPLGLSDFIREAYDGHIRSGIVLDGYSGKFEEDARIALALFEDNYLYFRRLGHTKSKSWFWAAARYNGGNTPNHKYAQRFNARVRFLRYELKWR